MDSIAAMRRFAAAVLAGAASLLLVACGAKDTSTLPATQPVIARNTPAPTPTSPAVAPSATTTTKTTTSAATATTTTPRNNVTGSVEHDLAALDTGDTTPNKATVRLYKVALDDLRKSCTNARLTLGSYAVQTVQQARTGTNRPNVLSVLQGVKRAIGRSRAPNAPAEDCTSTFTQYLQILTSTG